MNVLIRILALAASILFTLSASHVFAQSSTIPDKDIEGHGTGSNPLQHMAGNAAVSKGDPICGITHLVRCIWDLGEDEKGIFTSPLRVHPKDAYWLMPLGTATGFAFAYDADAAHAVGVDASRTNVANTITDFGSFYATGAESAGIYFLVPIH
jgi:hypothetical protein